MALFMEPLSKLLACGTFECKHARRGDICVTHPRPTSISEPNSKRIDLSSQTLQVGTD